MNFFKRPFVAVLLSALIVLCSTLVSINVKLESKCDAVSDIFYEGVRISGVDYPAMAEPMKQLCALTDDVILIANNYGIDTGELSQRLDDLELTVLHTPGHTPGSVCYLGNGLLFSGDTLFRQSIGRTDFPGGSMPQMRKSLTRLNGLSGDLLIYPGHNGASTLEYEKEHNPYLRDYI